MSWTAQQVAENLALHDACPEGAAWAAGKDSDAMWASADEFATPYLFWWAVQNIGQSGWSSGEKILTILAQLSDLACGFTKDNTSAWRDELARLKFTSVAALRFYYQLERSVAITGGDLSEFRQKMLPIINIGLRPSI